ncbi:hypothetical protein HQN90_00735 [Paenibacillus alba]|uniref:hypothetical protein n=1 Tax=Paenibacillus alba TaxID=1197127 RepID=UPI001563C5E7|nr:hypothetical protein [Paenibacillus alba]NQX64640.1 hypothetical protein [Paenibacillus alba]
MVKIETLQQYAQIGSPIITAITLIFVIVNVNRSQQKSKLNDEEKFRRDLNLKASDEMIAAISSLRRKSGYYFTQKDIRSNIKDELTLNNFVKHVSESAEIVEDAGLELQKIYNQRKIIMKEYDNDMESILNDCFSLSDNYVKGDIGDFLHELFVGVKSIDPVLNKIEKRHLKNMKKLQLYKTEGLF